MKIIATIALLVCAVFRTVAEEKDWLVSLSTDFVDKYVGFGNGAVFYDDPMFQTDLYIQHKSGFHADIWWGTGLNNNLSGGFDDEIDWNIGFAGTLGKVGYDLGIGYWDLVDLFEGPYNDLLHPYVEINNTINVTSNLIVTPFAKWEGYLLPFGSDYEQGIIASVGSRYCVKVSPRISLIGSTSFGYDDGGFGFDKGFIWKNYSNLEWALTEKLTLKCPTFQLYVPLGIADSRKTETVIGTGIAYSF